MERISSLPAAAPTRLLAAIRDAYGLTNNHHCG
jgi:hypothetical protein